MSNVLGIRNAALVKNEWVCIMQTLTEYNSLFAHHDHHRAKIQTSYRAVEKLMWHAAEPIVITFTRGCGSPV